MSDPGASKQEEPEVADDIVRIGEVIDLVLAGKLPREALTVAWARLWAERAALVWESEQTEEK